MPGMDGTGPDGKGQKTGRQLGKCEGVEPGKELGTMCGRGMRFGRAGRGRCRRMGQQ